MCEELANATYLKKKVAEKIIKILFNFLYFQLDYFSFHIVKENEKKKYNYKKKKKKRTKWKIQAN